MDDVEIERVFQAGQHPFLGQDLEEVREAMGVWLTRQRLAAAVRRWVESLTARTPIEYFARYYRDAE